MTVLNIKCGFINCLAVPLFQDENNSPPPRDGKAFLDAPGDQSGALWTGRVLEAMNKYTVCADHGDRRWFQRHMCECLHSHSLSLYIYIFILYLPSGSVRKIHT